MNDMITLGNYIDLKKELAYLLKIDKLLEKEQG